MTNTVADIYRRDGIVQVPQLLDAAEVEQLRTVFMDQVAEDHSLAIDDGVPDDDPLARFPRFVRFSSAPDSPSTISISSN